MTANKLNRDLFEKLKKAMIRNKRGCGKSWQNVDWKVPQPVGKKLNKIKTG